MYTRKLEWTISLLNIRNWISNLLIMLLKIFKDRNSLRSLLVGEC